MNVIILFKQRFVSEKYFSKWNEKDVQAFEAAEDSSKKCLKKHHKENTMETKLLPFSSYFLGFSAKIQSICVHANKYLKN